MNNIMLDLETMGSEANSAIISIGAVKFNDTEVTSKFHEIVDLQSCIDAGLNVTASTVLWWMGQSDEARSQFNSDDKIDIRSALNKFSTWVGDDAIVWGNGANFDNTILANAYNKTRIDLPWKFWNNRCYRTVKNLYPEIKINRVGTFHKAVDDAETQALHLIEIMKEIKGNK